MNTAVTPVKKLPRIEATEAPTRGRSRAVGGRGVGGETRLVRSCRMEFCARWARGELT